MRKRLKEYVADAVALVEEAGATCTFDTSRRHAKMQIELKGETRIVFFSQTVSDIRAKKNFTRDVKHALNELKQQTQSTMTEKV